MKITKISQQVKRANRYSIYVDDEYSFSLSETALLKSGIARGLELDHAQVDAFKQLSQDDKVYGQAIRYIAMRQRTVWEMQFYMERKDAPPALIEQILNKLSKLGLIDDFKYADAYVKDRRLLRSSSRRKITAELKKKRVQEAAIQAAFENEAESESEDGLSDERTALAEMVIRKRRQTKYQDNLKLMQYLARQGFSYDDIKRALQAVDGEIT